MILGNHNKKCGLCNSPSVVIAEGGFPVCISHLINIPPVAVAQRYTQLEQEQIVPAGLYKQDCTARVFEVTSTTPRYVHGRYIDGQTRYTGGENFRIGRFLSEFNPLPFEEMAEAQP